MAGEPISPVSGFEALFNEWMAFAMIANSGSEEAADGAALEMIRLEDQVAALVPQDMREMAMKVIIADDRGCGGLGGHVWKALVANAHATLGLPIPE